MRRAAIIRLTVLWLFASVSAYAQDAGEAGVSPDADATRDAGSSADAEADSSTKNAAPIGEDAGRVWASCVEHVPEGAVRPKLTNTFPTKGLAGHALTLQVQLEHGLGETVLPNGFHIQGDSDAARALATAGFVLPDPNGSSGPSLSRREEADKAFTDVQIHFLSLPEKPGRHELTLPPIPIAVSRASGEFLTLCTTPHTIVIDEPIANEPEAAPQGNPPPRPQREVWTLARDLTYGGLIGVLAAALVALLILWWRRRPKPPVPPPPPRPPWEVALEALHTLRRGQLVAEGKRAEHVDQVSDVVRVYLGARFGFDGIESTTDEVLQALRRIHPPLLVFDDVRRLLQDSDLVKFARWSPTDEDCEQVLDTAERIVRATMPVAGPPPPAPPPVEQEPNREGAS